MTARDTLNPLRWLWLAAAVLTVVAACTPLGGWLDGNVRVFGTRGVRVSVQVADAGFGTKAAPRTTGDIGFYRFKLYNLGLATVAAQYQTTATAFTFSTIPNGTYSLKAEAFSAGGVSLTAGGEQVSSNTATVSSPSITYSTGSSLAVTLPLLAGNGETLYDRLTVINGNPPPALAGNFFSAMATVAVTTAISGPLQRLAADSLGNVWVASSGANAIVKLSPAGTPVATVPCSGSPVGIAVDSVGNVWVAKNSANQIEKFDSNGVSQGTAAVGLGPVAVAIDPAGNAWVANGGAATVHKISPALASVAQFVTGNSPYAIAFDAFGNPLVSNNGSGDVRKLDPASGVLLGSFAVGGFPSNLAVDPLGQVWVANASGNALIKFSPGGTQLASINLGAGSMPNGVVVDRGGRIWLSDANSSQVRVYAANGVALGSVSAPSNPYHLASSPDGSVWASCNGSSTVHKLRI